jgi:hypothetical protein
MAINSTPTKTQKTQKTQSQTQSQSQRQASSPDGVGLGFLLAVLYNSGIIAFSKGLGPNLGEVDPLFNKAGIVTILIWGLIYAMVYYYCVSLEFFGRFSSAVFRLLSLVCAVEKAYFGVHWVEWLMEVFQSAAMVRFVSSQ